MNPAEVNLKHIERVKPSLRYDGTIPFEDWKKAAKEKLCELLGMDKIERCENAAFAIEYIKELDGYTEYRFTVESEPGYTVPCVMRVPKKKEGCLKGYLFKDAKKNRVFVTDTPQSGAKSCQTNYKVLASARGLSLVECELITGRTHQIRAQFAHAGHPLLGDGKYGKLDKRFNRNYQALYSYKLTFAFTTEAGALEHLNGKTFQVEQVDFVSEYFPEVK